ncbi:hypothetical protein [Nonomuraea sp. NPDC005650]
MRDPHVLARIRAPMIPLPWRQVWICRDPDARGGYIRGTITL